MKIQFLGAASTVTGSRFLLTHKDINILVDCGLFQGYKPLRLRNWTSFPASLKKIHSVLLTHAHLDHSGYLPLLVKQGFRGNIYATSATADLCRILLPDSGYLQEEEARLANRKGFSKHKPALPLYTLEDAKKTLKYFKKASWKKPIALQKKRGFEPIEFEMFPAGHLLGAASVCLRWGSKSIGFSGDIGRKADPFIRNPHPNFSCDYLVVESTYGNRKHSLDNPEDQIKEVVLRTYQRKGTLLIPSFAVGRAQTILYYLYRLKQKRAIPNIPIYLNSPMASSTNEVYLRHLQEFKLSESEVRGIWESVQMISSQEESIALNKNTEPSIIIASSGMATGGRVLHHLKTLAPQKKNTLLFTGFQAGGTRGNLIVRGAETVKIHGEQWPVQAEVVHLDSLSGHADGDEILEWINGLQSKPKHIFVTHGEASAADELRRRIIKELGIPADIPEQLDERKL